MINWESILPKKKTVVGDETTNELGYSNEYIIAGTYNIARNECLQALKAAEVRGEICKPLSVPSIMDLVIDNSMGTLTLGGAVPYAIALAIHNAMMNKER